MHLHSTMYLQIKNLKKIFSITHLWNSSENISNYIPREFTIGSPFVKVVVKIPDSPTAIMIAYQLQSRSIFLSYMTAMATTLTYFLRLHFTYRESSREIGEGRTDLDPG